MKITTFNPQIITNNAEQLIELFEALGFESNHKKEAIGEKNVTGIVMKNADGFKLELTFRLFPCLFAEVAVLNNHVETFAEGTFAFFPADYR